MGRTLLLLLLTTALAAAEETVPGVLRREAPDRRGPALTLAHLASGGRGCEVGEWGGDLSPDGTPEKGPRTVRVQVEVHEPDGRVTRGEIRTRPGRWGTLECVRTRHVVSDLDVEIACDNSGGFSPSAIADPIVREVAWGLVVDARPYLLEDGRRIALEVAARSAGPAAVHAFPTEARHLGRIDLPRLKSGAAAFSGTVKSGDALQGRLSTPGGDFRIRLVPTLESGGGEGAPELHLRPPMHPVEDEAPSRASWPRAGADLCLLAESPAAHEKGELWLEAGTDWRRRFDAIASRTTHVDLRLSAGADVLFEAAVSALAGRTAAVRAGEDRMVVGDDDVEVGCFIQIADPLVRPVFTGFLALLTPRPAPDGRSVALQLSARVAGMRGEPERRDTGSVRTGFIQMVSLESARIDAELLLVGDETTKLSLGRLPDGRPLLLEVRRRR